MDETAIFFSSFLSMNFRRVEVLDLGRDLAGNNCLASNWSDACNPAFTRE